MARLKWLMLVLAITMVMLPACAKKQVAPAEEPIEQVPPPAPPLEETKPQEQPPVIEEKPVVQIDLDDVFFEFDKYSIKDEYKSVLQKNAELLLASPDRKLRVEGYCDERGTNEYNMALGEKRAKAVVDFYANYGIKADRLAWMSYGEEKPFDSSHNEEAWAKNRRAHMVLQ